MKHSHLRGLKLLFCATLALAIVLSLLPAQEAKALKQGQTCPDCGTGILIPTSYNSEQHALSCSKTGCIHSTSAGYIWENHHGGNACTGRSICEGCGQEYGSALGHDWQTEWTIDGDVHYHACSRCTERKDEAAHNYVWTYVDDDTCKGVCACGAETTEAHYDRWASTCGRQPHCEKCDHDYGTIPEHEMWYEDRGESGHKPSCYHCDTYFFLESHTYGDWQDNGDGTHSRICAPCGRMETEGHAGGADTCTEGAKCSFCGAEYGNPLGHDLIDHEAQAPTCTEIGWDAYQTCSRCDYTTYAEKKALGHDLIDHEAQAPTCTAIGWDAYQTCSRCDYTTYTEKKALGHDLIDHPAQAPTCTAIGWDAYQTCSRCDYTTYTEKKALGHDLIDHAAQAPTCTAIGWDDYQTCSRCDYTTYAEKKALGHDLIDHEAKAPTCTEIGWDAYQTCSRCDYTTYVEKPALGHSEVTGTAIAPTCTDNGLTKGTYCFRCGQALIAQEDIPALGHDFAVTHRTITRVYFQCSRCRDSYWIDNAKSRNLLSSLVWNDRDENVEYTAGVAKANGIKVLTITPDAEAVEDSAWVSLHLTPGDVEQWKREGIGTVAFQCGEVRMEISLSALTLDWFDLNEPFDYYVFTLAPEEDGTLVTVEAEIGTEKVAADEYDGITLVRGDTILEIVQNGIY